MICRCVAAPLAVLSAATGVNAQDVLEAAKTIERDLDARVGVFLHDYETGRIISHNADERFPLNSTFKLLACGALLARVDAGRAELETPTAISPERLAPYSPVVKSLVEAGRAFITLERACAAALSVSDNTAANRVLEAVGGPEGLTEFLRDVGDRVTRLDRREPDLNEAHPGDPRDTTTPRAIAQTARALIVGETLSAPSRAQLRIWLDDHQVADALFRAVLPANWSIHDRTGAGDYGSRSIVAVLYPPDRAPIATAVYIAKTTASFRERNAAIATVGQAIVSMVEAG
ncbi:MAG: class A beta-lactamase [Maricaulaceae bacterium]